MSSYTMQLREYIEMWSQDEQISMKELIEKGRQKLFDFEYPIFNEEYKKVFETHFIREFYMREIGFETEGLFKFRLETWLNIHMPYFNKLFESELIEYDPLVNSEMNVTHTKQNDTNQNTSASGTSNQTGSSEGTGTKTDDNFSRNLKSNNPDSRLEITANDGEGVISYASEINEDNDNNKTETNTSNTGQSQSETNDNVQSDINSLEDFIQHRQGKIGVQSYSKMIEDYRSALIRVEKRVFDEMNELFMLIY